MTLACAGACTPKDGEPGETDTTSASSTGTEGATEPGETDTGEPTGGEQASCEAEPTDAAEFEYSFDWAADSEKVDVPCEVGAVTVDAGRVTTSFSCDVDGTPGAASLRFAVAPEGPVAWDAGLAVRLQSFLVGEFGDLRLVQVRAAADDALLAVAVWGGLEGPDVHEAFAPLTYGDTPVCGPPTTAAVPVQLDFEAPWGATLHLMQGQRGSLPIDAELAFAVEVGRAEDGATAHARVWQDVVLRRVRLGG